VVALLMVCCDVWDFAGARGPSPDLEFFKFQPDSIRRRMRRLMMKWRTMQMSFMATTSILGVGFSEPVLGDFQAAVRGTLAIQGVKWRLSSGAPPTAPARW
jgi:hypothetical protein